MPLYSEVLSTSSATMRPPRFPPPPRPRRPPPPRLRAAPLAATLVLPFTLPPRVTPLDALRVTPRAPLASRASLRVVGFPMPPSRPRRGALRQSSSFALGPPFRLEDFEEEAEEEEDVEADVEEVANDGSPVRCCLLCLARAPSFAEDAEDEDAAFPPAPPSSPPSSSPSPSPPSSSDLRCSL